MRRRQLILALLSATLAAAEPQTAAVYIQPIVGSSSDPKAPSPPPMPLAEISYDLSDHSDYGEAGSIGGWRRAEVTSFEAPELPADATLVRIGLYDAAAGAWASSTSVASADNFGKGYSPHFVLSVLEDDGAEEEQRIAAEGGVAHRRQRQRVLGASCKGVRVDAGATRDFGPQAAIVLSGRGRQPALNRPIVLSAEGKQVPPPEEKTLLQKYWWVLAIMVFLMVSGGGDGK